MVRDKAHQDDFDPLDEVLAGRADHKPDDKESLEEFVVHNRDRDDAEDVKNCGPFDELAGIAFRLLCRPCVAAEDKTVDMHRVAVVAVVPAVDAEHVDDVEERYSHRDQADRADLVVADRAVDQALQEHSDQDRREHCEDCNSCPFD